MTVKYCLQNGVHDSNIFLRFFSDRYQVWLEVYLRNGKVFQSNVVEVTTKDHQEPIDLEGLFEPEAVFYLHKKMHFNPFSFILSEMASPIHDDSHHPHGGHISPVSDGSGGETSTVTSSYYNSMVVAAIIAAFAILALLIVTALYLKRTTTYKAIISGQGGGSSKSSGVQKINSAAFKVRRRQKNIYRRCHIPGKAFGNLQIIIRFLSCRITTAEELPMPPR